MYLEKIDGYTCLTINNNLVKEQIINAANNLLGWVVAGIGLVTLFGAVYYGNVAYRLLTTLF